MLISQLRSWTLTVGSVAWARALLQELSSAAADTALGQMTRQILDCVPPRRLRQPRRPWQITFSGEGGIDAGGLFSEAMSLASDELRSGRSPVLAPTRNNAQSVGTQRDCYVPSAAFALPFASGGLEEESRAGSGTNEMRGVVAAWMMSPGSVENGCSAMVSQASHAAGALAALQAVGAEW